MKILVAHNRYQQPGGEDFVFENELRLLSSAGHDVRALVVSNEAIISHVDKALTMFRTVDNPVGIATMAEEIKKFRPDLVHIHNFFPLLSPAVYGVCNNAGVPVVQSLHNFRPFCANGLLMRAGSACHLCVRGSPLWGVLHRCYRHSVVGSLATARMIAVHRKRRTWSTTVDRYIALSEFGRSVFVEAGFPAQRIDVKPNFIEDPGEPDEKLPRSGVFYAGRLSPEKGVRYLVEACVQRKFSLRIAGDGPELAALRKIASSNVAFLGHISPAAVFEEMRRAAVVAIPSICYEQFPMAILNAFACATPIIVSRIGALPEIIEDGITGFHFPPADPVALAERIGQALRDPPGCRRLGNAGRRTFLQRYTPGANLKLLESIYKRALNRDRSQR